MGLASLAFGKDTRAQATGRVQEPPGRLEGPKLQGLPTAVPMAETRKLARCAIYTRKSTEHNLDLEFNSLDAQRESCEAYIKSQLHEGWRLVPDHYDDG